jgi:hypothetical protein
LLGSRDRVGAHFRQVISRKDSATSHLRGSSESQKRRVVNAQSYG